MSLRHGQAVWLMVLVTFLWSTAGVVSRQLESAQGFEVTFWRSFFTLLSLSIILPLWQGRQVWGRILRAGPALWFSGLCWSVMFTAFMMALSFTSVANVLVTMAAAPLLTALVARVFIGQKLPVRTWVAIVAAGMGIAWMFGRQLMGDVAVQPGQQPVLGTLIALCVPLAAAANWTLVQRARQHAGNEPVDMVPAVLIGALLSSLYTFPLAWPFGASGPDLAWLAGLGLWQLAVPCVLSVVCARVLSAPEVSLLALLEVVFGIALAWLGAGETPTTEVLTGGGLVLGALLLNEFLGWRERAAHFRIQTLTPTENKETA